MLRFIRNVWLVNSVLITMTVVLSILIIYWHYQMFQLYKIENEINKQNQIIIAINKQLLTEYSEVLSGMNIVEKSQKILMMRSPGKEIKELSL